MPRPNGKPCGRCLRDSTPGCDHLENTYDYVTLSKGLTDQDLIEYALNRLLALDRDNGNKRVGILPTRRYTSNLARAEDRLAKAKARSTLTPK